MIKDPAIKKAVAICRRVASELGAADIAGLDQVLAIESSIQRLRELQAWSRMLLDEHNAARRPLN